MKYAVCVVLCVAFLFLFVAKGKEIKQDQHIKGCYVTSCNKDNLPIFIHFVKVADKEYLDEDGKPEIWGYEPPLRKDKNGNPIFFNVPEERFVVVGKVKKVENCFCRCTSW